jgi:acetate kinase
VEAVEHLLGNLWSGDARILSAPSDIDCVGHRVIHGGPHYEEPVLITADVKSGIVAASAFAPLL